MPLPIFCMDGVSNCQLCMYIQVSFDRINISRSIGDVAIARELLIGDATKMMIILCCSLLPSKW